MEFHKNGPITIIKLTLLTAKGGGIGCCCAPEEHESPWTGYDWGERGKYHSSNGDVFVLSLDLTFAVVAVRQKKMEGRLKSSEKRYSAQVDELKALQQTVGGGGGVEASVSKSIVKISFSRIYREIQWSPR